MKGRAWRWDRGTRIEVLEDPVGEALIANVPLARQQREVFESVGYRVEETRDPDSIEDDEFLLFADALFVSPRMLRRFLRECRKTVGTGAGQLVLPDSALTRLTGFTGEQRRLDLGENGAGLAYSLWWVRGRNQEAVADVLNRARPVVIDPKAKELVIPFSKRIPTMTDITVPLTDTIAMELTSWVHLWMANLFSISLWLLGFLRSPRGWARLAWCVLRTLFSTLKWRPYDLGVKALGRLVNRGRGCKIHPSAVVEACVLGKNVEIGALSVVRGSIIGDDVNIMERSCVDGCVLGDGVLVNQGGTLKGVLVYPEAMLRTMQTGVVGRRSFLMGGFKPQDMKFQGTIRVQHRGGLADTGLSFLGTCVGHGVMIGGAVRLAAGRAIPNELLVLTEPEDRINVVPEGLPKNQFLQVRNGKLEVLEPRRSEGSEVPE